MRRRRVRLLLAMPAFAVGVLGLGLFTGAPRPVHGARLWGGPTEGPRVSWRVELVEADEIGVRPVPDAEVTVIVARGAPAGERGTTDATGMLEMVVENAPTGPLEVTVVESATHQEVARGRVALSSDAWSRRAGRRGGWLNGQRKGPLRVSLAPLRGALAVSFEDRLSVLVQDAEGRPQEAQVTLTCEGAEPSSQGASTDAEGRAAMTIVPSEHAPTCTVTAQSGERSGTFHGALPVVPGALNASRIGQLLVVESAVPSNVAYVALVTSTARVAAHAVPLSDSGGRYRGVRPLDASELRAQFAVVSSESDFQSPALVGWPLGPLPLTPPAQTFDVRDVLLLDGLPRALEREAERQRAVLRWTASAIGSIGIVTLILLWRAGRGDESSESASRLPASSAWLYVGMGIAALAFAAYLLAAWLGLA